jgi:hypothetical protein
MRATVSFQIIWRLLFHTIWRMMPRKRRRFACPTWHRWKMRYRKYGLLDLARDDRSDRGQRVRRPKTTTAVLLRCEGLMNHNGDRLRPSTERRFRKTGIRTSCRRSVRKSLLLTLGFEIAYQRPKEKFAYLERPEGAQIMLCERSEGRWETAPMEKPYGRGVMFQVYISSIDPIIDRLQDLRMPIYAGPREVWRRYGDREGGNERLLFWILTVTSSCWLKISVRDPSNCQELPKLWAA